ncbi:MAG: hypothetical protein EXR54_09660 [Dehalococcoidia bacterium]|nr:hypothetical protein [Dehalococcoidia bacterium]MSQ17799.1 hypothetical protein [Dehalococcoidia bacterium]
MGKFLDLMERIANGSPAGLGFGAARATKVPSMALITLVSGHHAHGLKTVATLVPDATLVSGLKGPAALGDIKGGLPAAPWGVSIEGLSEAEAKEYREHGCDLLAFPLQGTMAAALDEEEVGRVLCLEPHVQEPELRAIDTLPVDALLVNMTVVSGPWSLQDLMAIGAISRRSSKYVLVSVSQPPGKKDLEALRDLGVRGLVLDVGAVSLEVLKELKTTLLEMPRKRPQRKERTTAILPGSVYGGGQAAGPAHEPDHEEEEEDDE